MQALSRPTLCNGSRNIRLPASAAPIRVSAFPVARRASTVQPRASSGGDFDDFLIKMADKFEKSNNKAAVVGWSAAAVGAFFIAEWLMHLPVLNFLIGFPVQLLGLVMVPYLGVRYFVDGGNATEDAGKAASTIIKKLPGLDK